MRRETQHAVLVLLGGALIKIVANDTYLHYVKPSHRWWLLGAGAVMLAIAIAAIVRELRSAPEAATTQTCAHPHREPRSPWLLILPVLAIFLIAPPALGVDSVTSSATTNSVGPAAADGLGPLPPGDAPDLAVSEFVRRVLWSDTAALATRDVTLTGFVMHREGEVQLARIVITCCAADARPMLIRMRGLTDADDYPTGQWIRVRARLLPDRVGDPAGATPSVRVVSATEVTAPDEQYEY